MIGGDGLIGRALAQALRECGHEVAATSRRGLGVPFDMLKPGPLPSADVGYIVAAIIDAPESSDEAWRVNVDGSLAAVETMTKQGTFPVFISSRAVEVRQDAYARAKAHVEAALWGADAAVVRVGVFKGGISHVLDTLINVGMERRRGLTVVGGLR